MLAMPESLHSVFTLTAGLLGHLCKLSVQSFWLAVKQGQGVTKMANKWLRCLPFGGLNHLDNIVGCTLLRMAKKLYDHQVQAKWHTDSWCSDCDVQEMDDRQTCLNRGYRLNF